MTAGAIQGVAVPRSACPQAGDTRATQLEMTSFYCPPLGLGHLAFTGLAVGFSVVYALEGMGSPVLRAAGLGAVVPGHRGLRPPDGPGHLLQKRGRLRGLLAGGAHHPAGPRPRSGLPQVGPPGAGFPRALCPPGDPQHGGNSGPRRRKCTAIAVHSLRLTPLVRHLGDLCAGQVARKLADRPLAKAVGRCAGGEHSGKKPRAAGSWRAARGTRPCASGEEAAAAAPRRGPR